MWPFIRANSISTTESWYATRMSKTMLSSSAARLASCVKQKAPITAFDCFERSREGDQDSSLLCRLYSKPLWYRDISDLKVLGLLVFKRNIGEKLTFWDANSYSFCESSNRLDAVPLWFFPTLKTRYVAVSDDKWCVFLLCSLFEYAGPRPNRYAFLQISDGLACFGLRAE